MLIAALALAAVLEDAADPWRQLGLKKDARVRVERLGQPTLTGRLVDLSATELVVEDGGGTRTAVDVSTVRKLSARKRGGSGIVLGALGGALVGGLIGAATYEEPRCASTPVSWSNFCMDLGQGMPAAGGALIGLLGGAAIGASVPHWRGVDLGKIRAQATVAPVPGGLGARLSLAWGAPRR